MLKTYFLVAWRNFIRNKIFSLINVLGLSIGISASLAIFLIVYYDFTFDKFQKDRDRIYRVVMDMNFSGTDYHNSGVPSPLPEAVRQEVPGIESVIGFHQSNGDPKVTVQNKNNEKPLLIKHQPGIALVDSSYFHLVPYHWLAGSSELAVVQPFHVVLTAARAKVYFPGLSFTNIIGKQINYDDSIVCTVSGIVDELSQNTDFIFKEFISESTIPTSGLKGNYGWTSWGSVNGGSQCLLKLAPGISPKTITARLQAILTKYNVKDKNDHSTQTIILQPFNDIHFNPLYSTFGETTVYKPTLYGLMAVAAFLLLLACINFINLTTAQSSQRGKEIGVRKTLGGSRKQLIGQFLSETFFLSFISFVLSLLITPFLLKIFSDFIPKGLQFNLSRQPLILVFGLGLTLIVALFAGFYPALVLSSFKPVMVLKNQSSGSGGSSRSAFLRKSLTVSQFLIAQVFTMATLIAVKQIHFIMNKNLGFKKEAIITVETPFPWGRDLKTDHRRIVLMDRVNKLPGVDMVSLGSDPPAGNGFSSNVMTFRDGKKEIQTDASQKYGDTNYLKLYHIPLLAGRQLRVSDTANEWIINETYLHTLGFDKPADVLNMQISGFPVVGVIADFNAESLHAPVKPLMFSSEIGNSWLIHIALKTGETQAASWENTISSIEKLYKQIYPEEDFSYGFVDETIARFYDAEQNMSSLLKWATGLAIFISCMGLLGLVIYTTNIRTKEIGIRKVLGASIKQIVSILSKDFMKLVLVASAFAIPMSWWIMNKWLEDFAYRTRVSWWVFALSIVGMILIALFTLSIQTIRAASANPVDSLRSE